MRSLFRRPRERARGYALLMSFIFTAVILGASAVVLESARRSREAARAQLAQAFARSAEGSAASWARSEVLAAWQRGTDSPARAQLGTMVLERPAMDVTASRVELPIAVSAAGHRAQRSWCFTRASTARAAWVGTPPIGGGVDVKGGVALPPAQPSAPPAVDAACDLSAMPDGTTTIPSACTGAVRLRLGSQRTTLVDPRAPAARALVLDGDGELTLAREWRGPIVSTGTLRVRASTASPGGTASQEPVRVRGEWTALGQVTFESVVHVVRDDCALVELDPPADPACPRLHATPTGAPMCAFADTAGGTAP